MSAKTKIVVLHMKELIYTGIFAALGILFLILLVMMFLPDKKDGQPDKNNPAAAVNAVPIYIPGVYTTELVLGNDTIDVEVVVDRNTITSIRMVNLNDAVTTMYPLLEPTFESICNQVYELQTLEGVTYSSDNKYTSLVLLETLQTSLDKAMLSQ
ncbi:MAG: hypothetical protein ACI4HQ_06395 [Acetatifactor sp.]